LERSKLLANRRVPKSDEAIVSARDEELCIGRKCHAEDAVAFSQSFPPFLAGCQIPNPHQSTVAAGCQSLPVVRVRCGERGTPRRAKQLRSRCAGFDVPDSNCIPTE